MKTNKITVTITLEYEDNRNLEDRAMYPINRSFVRYLISEPTCYDDSFISNLKEIHIYESNPLTEDQIKIGESCAKISKVLYDEDDSNTLEENEKLYEELGNWNWRQDCSN